jgi:acyl transferase domain-containing protein/acyl carrier protein
MIREKRISPEEGFKLLQQLWVSPERPESRPVEQAVEPEPPRPHGPSSDTKAVPTDIAVIGMAGRFPGAQNLDEYWRNLVGGVDSVVEVPESRWKMSEFYDPDIKAPNKSYCKWSGLLSGIDEFDPLFFGITPKEAELMDPQQRLFLEEAWKALESVGYSPEELSGRKCGVFVGVGSGDYRNVVRSSGATLDSHFLLGSANSILSARISYFLNLTGPNIAVDTACSSSLVAIHQGCQSIVSGESDMVLAGGVCTFSTPEMHITTSKGGMLSRSGRCKTFDQDADGFVPSEGVGVVVLKPLARALEDGDTIYGVIKGWGINQDGKTNGLTAPSANSQTGLVTEVYDRYNVNPADITYVEAHGTGTKLGDPIEVSALTRAFRQHTGKRQFCAIGSVKSNIGHALAAAGVASLIKVLLCLHHRKLVPSVHYKRANEHIDFDNSPFYVNTEARDWTPEGDKPRLAAVSAFGLSGSNCHLVVGGAPVRHRLSAPRSPQSLVPLSARTEEALEQRIADLGAWLEAAGSAYSLEDIAYTLSVGRAHFPFRCAMVVTDLEDLNRTVRQLLRKEPVANVYRTGGQGVAPGVSASRDARLSDLAERYIRGEALRWKELLPPMQYRRIPLPTYPFARTRLWLSGGESCANGKGMPVRKLHPLVHENRSTFREQKFATELLGSEFFLTDHVVRGAKMAPGASLVEMARAAAELAAERKVAKLKSVVWMRPVVMCEHPLQIQISLTPNDPDGAGFQIASGSSAGLIKHCRGKVTFSGETETAYPEERIDLEAVRQRCQVRLAGSECYQVYRSLGVEYGPAFQCLEDVYSGEDEALASIRLPVALHREDAGFVLHPTILDGALQTVLGVRRIALGDSAVTYVPYAIGELELRGTLPEKCYAHVTLVGDPRAGKGHTFNIRLTDEAGRVLVGVNGYAIRPYAILPAADTTAPSMPEDVLYFRSGWTVGGNVAELAFPHRSGSMLVCGAGQPLTLVGQRLAGAGFNLQVVQPGEAYRQVDGRSFTVRPNRPDDYTQLLQTLRQAGQLPETVLLLADTFVGSGGGEASESALLPLMYLTQALMQEKLKKVDLLYVYETAAGRTVPQHAAVAGFARALKVENPSFLCKVVQVTATPGQTVPAQIASAVVGELAAGFDALEVRHEGNQRYLKVFSEYRPVAPGAGHAMSLRHRGVYLLTGGAGGLGLIFARYLAQQVDARLVLVGRSALSGEKLLQIRELEEHGAEVVYLTADMSDLQQVQRVIHETKARFGALNGIIHSAGVVRDSFLMHKTADEVKAVLAPKVSACLALDQATKDEPLDFFMLFSAMASVVGNVGQCDYAYANSFLDHFAELREQRRQDGERRGKTVAVNWPLWKEGGMRVTDETARWLKNRLGMAPLDTSHGIDAFMCALGADAPHLAVVQGEPDKIRLAILAKAKGSGEEAGPAGADDTVLYREIERHLQAIFAKATGLSVSALKADQPFDSFGIDSILTVSINSELEDQYGELSKTLLFEYRTIRDLAAYFVAHHKDKVAHRHRQVQPAVQDQPAVLQADRLEAPEARSRDIAIIGLSGRYPKAGTLEQFWENLKNGLDCITEVPGDRWDHSEYYDPDKDRAGKSYTKWGGFIDDVSMFDPLLFSIAPREAELMDPQERLFLEVAWQAFEDAGYARSELSQQKVGVFVGVMYEHYQLWALQEQMKGNPISIGSTPAAIANRVSYCFNLTGPSLALDTMCSSSLTSIHLACESIRRGESDMALAGGVNLTIHPSKYLILSQGKFAATDGRCRSFGAGGDGYVPGEGVGAVLLKPLDKAVADGNQIYGVIKGSAINHGGRTNGYTVPNPNAQGDVITGALKQAGVAPETISYVEAHGTGTSLGDPIEVRGLVRAFGPAGKGGQRCALGAVKSNIGHLEAAAGIAGVTKVLLQMRHRTLVPSIHADTLNPNIRFEDSPFYVQCQLSEWRKPVVVENGQTKTYPRRAGISAFGAGGANAHLILEEFEPPAAPAARREGGRQVMVLSARTEERLKEYAATLGDFMQRTCLPGDRLDDGELLRLTQNEAAGILACLINVDVEHIDAKENFADYDMDAMTLANFAARVSERFSIPVTAAAVSQYPTIHALAAHLLSTYGTVLQGCIGSAEGGAAMLSLADIAYTLQVGREPMPCRLAVLASSISEVVERLSAFSEGRVTGDTFTGNGAPVNPAEGEGDPADLARQAVQAGDLARLAELWVSGCEVNWRSLHTGRKTRRVSLPTYPFARKRYWLRSHQEPVAPAAVPKVSAPVDAPAYQGDEVDLQIIDGNVALLTMQDRQNRNMFSEQLIAGLEARFAQVRRNPDIKVIVLTGYDNVFCMGGTQQQLVDISDRKSSFTDVPFLYRGLLETEIPVVSAIQGHASGGGLLFGLYGDIILMSEESVYSAVFMKYGFTPGMGATFVLKEKLGNNLATEMMFTARTYMGEELKGRGSSIVFRKRAEVLLEALSIARMLAEKPIHSLRVLKRELAGRILEQLPRYIEREASMHLETFSHPEVKHRIERYFAGGQKPTVTVPKPEAAGGKSRLALRSAGAQAAPPEQPPVATVSLSVDREQIRAGIATIVCRILHLTDGDIRTGASFRELGADSISGIEMVRHINKEFRLELEAAVLYDFPTLDSLTDHVFAHVRKAGGSEPVRVASTTAPERRGQEDVQLQIKRIVGRILHIESDELNLSATFQDLGADSISGVEIVRDVNRTFGINLDAVALYDHPNIDALAAHVYAHALVVELPTGASGETPVVQPGKRKLIGLDVKEYAQYKDRVEAGREPAELDTGVNFQDLGADSISGVEIVRDINRAAATLEEAPPPKQKLIGLDVKEYAQYRDRVEVGPKPLQIFAKPPDGSDGGENRHQEPDRAPLKRVLKPLAPKQPAELGKPVEVVKPVEVARPDIPEGVAIIGMAGRFPGARSVQEFWHNLRNGVDSVTRVPGERWDADAYYDATPRTPGKTYCPVGGFLADVDQFDPLFFNISPVEAESMDPQQRLFLEEAWNALEDAGYSSESLSNVCCGVFVGAAQSDYARKLSATGAETSADAFTGLSPAILAARISYLLNLKGPSIAMDTACSSSLVAIHHACLSIRAGDCDMALAGGVRLLLTPELHIQTSQMMMLSPTGSCKTFDQDADGTAISEGVGVVVLKPLAAALRDRDHIYGVIRGSGVNQDGKTNGITAPSAQSQTQLELGVYRRSGIDPSRISYVEAHGTGTKLGDPIEVKALRDAFEAYTQKKQYCAIGSVKTNIGHATMAAGVAGVIKVLLALKHKQIPPSLHFRTPNEHIHFERTPFYVSDKLIPWEPAPGARRLAAVSAFGFSGTNCHLVIEEAPESPQ